MEELIHIPNNRQAVLISLPPGGLTSEAEQALQQDMEAEIASFNQESNRLMEAFDIPCDVANQLVYLRTRGRWSHALEKAIVNCYRATGTFDFRATSGGERAVLETHGFWTEELAESYRKHREKIAAMIASL